MDIRPIRTEEDYEWAVTELDRLFGATEGTVEADKLDILAVLVAAYEKKHYQLPPPDPIEAINYWMESRNLTRKDLEPYIGSRPRVAEVLNRKRPLTLRMIRNLERGLGIPAEILVREYPLAESLDRSNEEITWTHNKETQYKHFELHGMHVATTVLKFLEALKMMATQIEQVSLIDDSTEDDAVTKVTSDIEEFIPYERRIQDTRVTASTTGEIAIIDRGGGDSLAYSLFSNAASNTKEKQQ